MRRDAPATHRNREPIAAVLARWLREPARVLELASGTGQHAAFFAERMPHVVWQPTDVEDSALASIDAWATGSRVPNVARAIRLDAREVPWPVEVPDAPPFDPNHARAAWPQLARTSLPGASCSRSRTYYSRPEPAGRSLSE